MPAYSAAEWESLFVAEAGASAALAGLLFVALSINLERILKGIGLPGRAGGGNRPFADSVGRLHVRVGARSVAEGARR